MDSRTAATVAEVYRLGREHDARTTDRLERMRNLDPDSAAVLAQLVRAVAARRILEIGTSIGYSTLWLADAAREVGGRVTTVDIDAQRSALAQAHLERAGLMSHVTLHVDDAQNVLSAGGASSYDFIFLDAERQHYASYWPSLCRLLRQGGSLVIDNVVSHAEEMAEMRQLIRDDVESTEVLVPTGSGLLFVVR